MFRRGSRQLKRTEAPPTSALLPRACTKRSLPRTTAPHGLPPADGAARRGDSYLNRPHHVRTEPYPRRTRSRAEGIAGDDRGRPLPAEPPHPRPEIRAGEARPEAGRDRAIPAAEDMGEQQHRAAEAAAVAVAVAVADKRCHWI